MERNEARMKNFLRLCVMPICVSLTPPANAQTPDPQPDVSTFYSSALCDPPYNMDHAEELSAAAEKLGKADETHLGVAIYTLPTPFVRDGFSTRMVMFAGSAYGVLIEGQVADALAVQYHLDPESNHMLGASTKGFSRALPADQQAMADIGTVWIVARESPALPGQTMLACEFVSKEDQQELDGMERATSKP